MKEEAQQDMKKPSEQQATTQTTTNSLSIFAVISSCKVLLQSPLKSSKNKNKASISRNNGKSQENWPISD